MPARILIVDDHQMLCDGLRLMLEKFPDFEVVGTCGCCATASRLIKELRPDLVLMDVDLPDGSGIGLTRRIRTDFPDIKVLVLTAHFERSFAAEAIAAGAHGYLVKTNASQELLGAVRTILTGCIHLSAEMSAALAESPVLSVAPKAVTGGTVIPLRESQVLGLLLRGMRNKEIAAELFLSVKTVETYRSRLMKRFGCTSPAELVRCAIREGLAPP